VTLRRTEVDLAVERDVEGEDGVTRRYRMTSRLVLDPPDGPVPEEELKERFRALTEELDRLVPAGRGGDGVREERSTTELVETYRPRQVELLDLLREEGEISAGEFTRLRQYLSDRPGGVAPEIPVTDRPIAAAPLAVDRSPIVPRSTRELLELYRIESLKQAGAVRARRQISYEEYMSLKRHFAPVEPGAATPATTEPRT
jgi:hypothetical protein